MDGAAGDSGRFAHIGRMVVQAREFRGLSQADVAARMQAKGWTWSQTKQSRLEQGKQRLELSEASALANALGIMLDDLVQGTSAFSRLDYATKAHLDAMRQLIEALRKLVSVNEELAHASDDGVRSGEVGDDWEAVLDAREYSTESLLGVVRDWLAGQGYPAEAAQEDGLAIAGYLHDDTAWQSNEPTGSELRRVLLRDAAVRFPWEAGEPD